MGHFLLLPLVVGVLEEEGLSDTPFLWVLFNLDNLPL